ncbi:hypothetical protein ACLMAL_36785 [Nocardia sp. CWNU-33]
MITIELAPDAVSVSLVNPRYCVWANDGKDENYCDDLDPAE